MDIQRLERIVENALQGAPLSRSDAALVIDWPEAGLNELAEAAHRVRQHFFGDAVSFCGIVNARSGACSENCAFCAQSAHHAAQSPRHDFLPLDEIVDAARSLKAAGATRFSIVTSGKALSPADFQRLLDAVAAVADLGLVADCSPGILDRAQLRALRQAGCGAYHHNLETGRSFFPRICSTHAYDEDVEAVRNAVAEGLTVCSGGLFGLGETWADRLELAGELRELGVQSVPVNFLQPIPGTPLQDRPLVGVSEAVRILALLRFSLPDRHIRICGGRHSAFAGEDREQAYLCGASGVMVGDYLTLKGRDATEDRTMAERLGLHPE